MKTFLSIFGTFLSVFSFGQEVGSKTYSKMLNTLLDHSVPEISVAEVPRKEVVYLDAREFNEFEVSRIPNARWVGYQDFTMDRISDVSKDAEIIVYCSVGYRSEKIAEKLIAAGYDDVSNLYGGIFEWVNQDNPLIDSGGEPTTSVHAYDYIWGVWLRKGKKVYK